MTDAISATSPAQTTTTTTTTPESETAAATATLSSDFETFLTLMTTQLENQDPLNPMDSAEYSTQLATFASVEQQALTNEYLVDLTKTMEEMFGTTGLSAYSDWIGKEVLAAGPTYFDGVTPKSLDFQVPSSAQSANLVAYDVAGNEVSRQVLPLNANGALWSGMTADGTLVPEGLYSFGVEVIQNDEVAETIPLEVYNTVDEIQIVDGETLVVMEGGGHLFLLSHKEESVAAIRDHLDAPETTDEKKAAA